MADKTKDIQKPERGADLPPPGDARREELRRREDELQARGEEIAAKLDLNAIDPDVLKIDNEIASHYDREAGTVIHISNPQSDRAYCWANYICQHGNDVIRRKAVGWQLVSGNDPECRDLRDEQGRRKLGDLVLMWIPRARKEQLDALQEAKTKRRYEAEEETMRDIADRHPGKFIVHSPRVSSYVGSRAEAMDALKGEASRRLGNMLRNEIPGLPIPGKGR